MQYGALGSGSFVTILNLRFKLPPNFKVAASKVTFENVYVIAVPERAGVELTVGVGVLLAFSAVTTILPLLQTSFDPFLMQVNSLSPEVFLDPTEGQLAPALTAAFAGNPGAINASPIIKQTNFFILILPTSFCNLGGILD
jgi:hypothetical protein